VRSDHRKSGQSPPPTEQNNPEITGSLAFHGASSGHRTKTLKSTGHPDLPDFGVAMGMRGVG
jgi:hypothetical protein